MFSLALVLVLAMYATPLSAADSATLSGYVTDMDGQPITACYIDVSDENYVSLANAYTDDNGYYELRLPSRGMYNVYAGKTDLYNFMYIPQSKATCAGQLDLTLAPGANLVINAYDSQGNLLRNEAFRQVTRARVFATTLDGTSDHGCFAAIHDEHSNWDWNQAIPAVVVQPGTSYAIQAELEVPGIGRMMLKADNAGNGYSVAEPGGQATINLNHEIARSSLAMLRQAADNGFAAEIAASAQHLAAAEEYMARTPADMKSVVSELNLSLRYSLEAREQLVLDRAQTDIELYRKGDVQLTVVDSKGKPLSNCQVTFSQVSNDFLFGANPMGANGSYDSRIAGLMKDAGINQSYVTARWGLLEPQPAKFTWDNIDSYQKINEQLKSGFQLMGALSLWSSPNTDFTPPYMYGMSFEQLKKNVYNHVYKMVGRYKGKIDTWEINEMNLASANALGLTQEQRLELMDVFTAAARAANPGVRILNGSTALPYEFSDSLPFPALLESGVPADIIGLELYYSGVNADGHSPVGLDLAAVSDLLDLYSNFGKPVYIKELSAPSIQFADSSWWHQPWCEQTQAEYVERLYTIAFSKPMVQAITWSWGVTDADAFIMSGGLLDDRGNPKPAYYALKNLLRSWTSNESGITDRDGRYAFRGFGGEYTVTITAPGRRSYNTRIHVTERESDSITIQVR